MVASPRPANDRTTTGNPAEAAALAGFLARPRFSEPAAGSGTDVIALVILVLAVMGFVGVLVWSCAAEVPKLWREVVLVSALSLFVTLPSLVLAIGAVT